MKRNDLGQWELEDDDVDHHDGYVTVKNPQPCLAYFRESHTIIGGISLEYQVVYPHSGVPLLIKGIFLVPDGVGGTRAGVYSVDTSRDWAGPLQRHSRVGNDYNFGILDHFNPDVGTYLPPGAVQVRLAQVPPSLRRPVRDTLVSALTYRYPGAEHDRVANRLRLMLQQQVRGRQNPPPGGVAHIMGVPVHPSRWATARRDLVAGFAGYIKAMKDGDSHATEQAAEFLNEYADSSRYSGLCGKMVETWNDVADQENEGCLTVGHCGHIFPANDGHETSDGEVCTECFEDNYVYVEDQEEYWHSNNAYYHESRDAYYSYEEEEDDDDDYGGTTGLLNSWGASCRHLAHDRSFTPTASGDFTMGIELEVEATDGRSSALRACNEYFNSSRQYAMFKKDGSLSEDDGFEIVTAARRMDDHIKVFGAWEPEGITSWDAGNCGMHVHIDSRAFSALTLGKFLMFYNQPGNAAFIRGIAGRHPDDGGAAGQYAGAIKGQATESPTQVKSCTENRSRYVMVNVTNLNIDEQQRLSVETSRDCKGSYSTVEVRIFRGTLRKARLLAQIEFAHAAVAFCRAASWQELDGAAFKHWLGTPGGQQYKNLRKWYGIGRSEKKFANRQETLTAAAEV